MLQLKKAASLVIALLLSACAHSPPAPGGPIVSVSVEGPPDALLAFDQALQPTIQGAAVGCKNCDLLGTTRTLTYDFYQNQAWLYQKFGAAWNTVPAQPPGDKPVMTVFLPPQMQPDCTTRPGCYNLTPCSQYGRCTTDSSRKVCTGPCP